MIWYLVVCLNKFYATIGRIFVILIVKIEYIKFENIFERKDTVSRLGGDEFVIIVSALADRNDIKALLLRIDFDITKPCEFEGQELKLRASIGYALFSEDGIELEVLIEKADRSMYHVKRIRKGAGNVR